MNDDEGKMHKFCAACLDAWGERDQIDMLQEEMSELGVAAAHWKRGRSAYDNFIEEIADVELMCKQMRILIDNNQRKFNIAYGSERIEEIMQDKMQRTLARMKEFCPVEYNKHYGELK